MTEKNELMVAFLAARQTKDKEGYLGAVLVLNEAGVPQEFHCTHPVRATSTQEAIYGATLKPHVFNELIGAPLINRLTTNPKFCAVSENLLLDLGYYTDLPVVHLQRIGEVFEADNLDTSYQVKRFDSNHSEFQPVSANFLPSQELDTEIIEADIEAVFNRIDIIEPFERISTALNTLVERDERFR